MRPDAISAARNPQPKAPLPRRLALIYGSRHEWRNEIEKIEKHGGVRREQTRDDGKHRGRDQDAEFDTPAWQARATAIPFGDERDGDGRQGQEDHVGTIDPNGPGYVVSANSEHRERQEGDRQEMQKHSPSIGGARHFRFSGLFCADQKLTSTKKVMR